MKFGEKLREARIARGLSQKELAKRTGIAVRTIINYESNARMPKKQDSYARLAEVLDVDVDSLKDDNADFIIKASEKYGSRAKRQAEKRNTPSAPMRIPRRQKAGEPLFPPAPTPAPTMCGTESQATPHTKK